MYQISRALYRQLAPHITGGHGAHEHVLHACERTTRRLIADRLYFARPARSLFQEVRPYVAMQAQPQVWHIIERYIACAHEQLERMPRTGIDVNGEPLQCRATTRRGTPCQRVPLHSNGYCPSHQHLAETEEAPVLASLAA